MDGSKKRKPWRAVFGLLAVMTLAAVPAVSADLYGMLPMRDLSPFGFLRLDMRPTHAVLAEPKRWTLETEFATQNTWAMSPEVEEYLTGLESSGRRPLGESELAAIRELPGENYLVDLETTTVDVTLNYRFTSHLSGYLITSAVSYDRGFLDGTVERFHDAFGSQLVRQARHRAQRRQPDLRPRSRVRTPISVARRPAAACSIRPSGCAIQAFRSGGPGSCPWKARSKLALGGERRIAVDRPFRLRPAGGRAVARYSPGFLRQCQPRCTTRAANSWWSMRQQIVPTLIVGYEYALTANTNLNIQGYASTSVYSRRDTDLDELLDNKYQLTAGFRHRRNDLVISFGITENVQNINNTPDIGLQLGMAWMPGR